MAVTVTPVYADTQKMCADVEATADADVAAVVPHGLLTIPTDITLTPLLAVAYLSVWTVGVVDAVNINLVKGNVVGSGAAGDQVRVSARVTPEPW